MKNVRASDPITSVIAAERSALFSGKQKERILASIQPGTSMTAKDMSGATGLTVEQVCRRLPELQTSGYLQVVKDASGEELMSDGYRIWKKK